MSKKILLIGAGPTSSLIAYNLGQLTKIKVPLDIHIWEGSKGIGGRFSTTQSPHHEKCFADFGAQYLTHTKSRPWSRKYFDYLSENGFTQKFSTTNIAGFKSSIQQLDDKENYVCTKGTGAVVQFFIDKANVKRTCFNKRVVGINIKNDVSQVEVISNEEQVESFDVVITTMPVPQLLQLKNVNGLLRNLHRPEVDTALANVSYTSRYALGLFYKTKLELRSDERGMNYVDNDPIIRYWTLEDEKRALNMSQKGNNIMEEESLSSVVVHTTVKFGAENMDKDLEEVKELLMRHIEGRFKTLVGVNPDYVTLKKWRYSQVDVGYQNSPGFIELSSLPVILAAGDSFTYSGFEGCILSAEKTVEKLESILGGEQVEN